jgi:hypothetical protein
MPAIAAESWPPQLRAAHVRSILEDPDYPENDCDVLEAPRASKSPRHRKLAPEVRPLLDWRRLVTPKSELPPSWCAANDNNEDDDLASLTTTGSPPRVECEWEMRPGIEEIERALEEGGAEAVQKLWKKDEQGTPYGAKQESQSQRDLAIFALKYALAYFNEPVEPAQPDQHWRHIPTKHAENAEKIAARAELAAVGRDVPFEQARTRAWRYTVANDNEPAFPRLPKDPREIFYTGRVRPNPDAQRGGEFNDGVCKRLADLQEAAHIRGKLSKDTVRALDVAIDAHNIHDVGIAFGLQGKHAERRGKQITLAACAELMAVLAEAKSKKSLFAD